MHRKSNILWIAVMLTFLLSTTAAAGIYVYADGYLIHNQGSTAKSDQTPPATEQESNDTIPPGTVTNLQCTAGTPGPMSPIPAINITADTTISNYPEAEREARHIMMLMYDTLSTIPITMCCPAFYADSLGISFPVNAKCTYASDKKRCVTGGFIITAKADSCTFILDDLCNFTVK